MHRFTLDGRLQVGDELDVAVLVGEQRLTAPQIPLVAAVDLFGLDLDGHVPVRVERIAPDAGRPDLVRPQ